MNNKMDLEILISQLEEMIKAYEFNYDLLQNRMDQLKEFLLTLEEKFSSYYTIEDLANKSIRYSSEIMVLYHLLNILDKEDFKDIKFIRLILINSCIELDVSMNNYLKVEIKVNISNIIKKSYYFLKELNILKYYTLGKTRNSIYLTFGNLLQILINKNNSISESMIRTLLGDVLNYSHNEKVFELLICFYFFKDSSNIFNEYFNILMKQVLNNKMIYKSNCLINYINYQDSISIAANMFLDMFSDYADDKEKRNKIKSYKKALTNCIL